MDDSQRRAQFLAVKYELWSGRMHATYLSDKGAEAKHDPRAARELLVGIRHSMSPDLRILYQHLRGSNLEPGRFRIPAEYLDFMHAAFSDYLDGKAESLDEAFGLVKTGRGNRRNWTDREEQLAAEIPHTIIMRAKDKGQHITESEAIQTGAETLRGYATNGARSTHYGRAANISDSTLQKKFYKWKAWLSQAEQEVEKAACDLINLHGPDAEK